MIYLTKDNMLQNTPCSLTKELDMCMDFIRHNDMNSLKNGSYIIDGDNVYVNIVEYNTKLASEGQWEAHKKYLDLHYVISGQEIIQVSSLSSMVVLEYVEEEDYVKNSGDAESDVHMKANSLLLLFPEDAHKTAVIIDKSEKVKKAIFKIKIC